MCRVFSTILKSLIRKWYAHLKLLSISSFVELAKEFKLHFLRNVHPRPMVVMLLRFGQGEEEILLDFVTRFMNEILGMDNVHPSLVIQSFMMGLKPSHLFWSLVERTSTKVPEIFQMTNQYIVVNIMVSS